MSSRWRNGVIRTFGARIAAWYFALFAIGALIILVVAGLLLSASLARRDQDALTAALIRYTDAYAGGGVTVLDRLIAADRAAASYEPLFVRVIAGGRTRMLSLPVEWSRFDFEAIAPPPPGGTTLTELAGATDDTMMVVSARLGDGTVFQVGRTTAARRAVLERYREAATLLFGVILVAGLAGGVVLTSRALRPLRDLSATITRILETGRTTERVPVRGTSDPVDALGALVNRMLARIDALVEGMRSSLDNVAHDLRTPMTRLRGTAEMALHTGGSEHDYREALADCVEEADRVRAILDALMDLAEAETGTMRLRREPVQLDDLARDAVELYDAVADARQVRLEFVDTGEMPAIVADPTRVRQAIANVVDNAVKYTSAGGRVRVLARAANGGAEVQVADTGPGIAPEDQSRIWERLYRGDESRSARGLGIGLSLVRAIIEAHGGRVAVESRPGQGATFTLWLPREMTSAR